MLNNTPMKNRYTAAALAFFLGGLDKTYVLKEFKPQIFFDDQHVHTDRASLVVPAGTVPYKSDSVLAKPKEEEKKGEK